MPIPIDPDPKTQIDGNRHGSTVTTPDTKAYEESFSGPPKSLSNENVLKGLYTASPIHKGQLPPKYINGQGDAMISKLLVTEGDVDDAKAYWNFESEYKPGYGAAPDINALDEAAGGVGSTSTAWSPNLGSPTVGVDPLSQPATPEELRNELHAKPRTENTANPSSTSAQITDAIAAPPRALKKGSRPGTPDGTEYVKFNVTNQDLKNVESL